MVCISNHVFFLLSHVIFFQPSHDIFPLPSVLIAVFLCRYPWTLLFPGTFSDSWTGSLARASPILAWLWHYQHHLSVSAKSTSTRQQENSSQIFTRVSRRHAMGTHQTLLHRTVGIKSIKMSFFYSTIVSLLRLLLLKHSIPERESNAVFNLGGHQAPPQI